MVKKGALVLFLVVILLFGCAGGAPEDERRLSGATRFVRSGTSGLEIDFAKDLPPRRIYDSSDLMAIVELNNKGAEDIKNQDCFVQLGGYEESILKGINKRQSCDEMPGKNVYNLEGSYNQIEFSTSSVFLPRGVDRYEPKLVATACYEYKTTASPQVCIDSKFYELTSDQKSCTVRDVSLGGGQGAPIAISRVSVDMVGSNKVTFGIQINNVGGGRVVSPRTSLSKCPTNLGYNDFDEVRVKVEMIGKPPDRCVPEDNLVRLHDGKGTIFCTFQVGNNQAYETPLKIELSYNYMTSISKGVEIIKTP